MRLPLMLALTLTLSSCLAPSPPPDTTIESEPAIDLRAIAIQDALEKPVCNQEYALLTLEMFEECFVEGMTYVQVGNIIGYEGKLNSSSGSTKIYSWPGQIPGKSAGTMSVVFQDGKLTSKSQVGLENSY